MEPQEEKIKLPPKDNLLRNDPSNLDEGREVDLPNSLPPSSDPIKIHDHDGQNSKKIPIRNISGFFEIVSVAPTIPPKNLYEQIKLYVNGATYRIYFYDYKAKAWRFA